MLLFFYGNVYTMLAGSLSLSLCLLYVCVYVMYVVDIINMILVFLILGIKTQGF